MKFCVIASSPTLELSGANVLLANLLDALSKMDMRTDWLVTGHEHRNDSEWLGERRFPIRRLPPTRISDVRRRQTLLLEYLKAASPCIYLPNFDFDMACAIPATPDQCRGVLIMHCDDPVYYGFVERHGGLFDAIVCVSSFLATRLREKHPELSERIVHIPFGIAIPEELPSIKMRGSSSRGSLRVAYCGRLSFHQKRVQDLATIISKCHDENLPVEFHIAGSGPDEQEFFESIRIPLEGGRVHQHGFLKNSEVIDLLEQSDVLVMTSNFEGLPVVLLEAMSRGCIPVVTDIQSGIGEVVRHQETGYLHPIGDMDAFVATLADLARDTHLRQQMSDAAFKGLKSGGFTLERAVADYLKLFESIFSSKHQFPNRPSGPPLIPDQYRFFHRMKQRISSMFPWYSQ